MTASGTLTASTVNGNITLDSGATLTANGTGDAIKLEAGVNTAAGTTTGGDFVNNSGVSALSAPNGNWLVYTGDLNQGQGCTGSSCTVVGGLTPYTERLGTSTTNFTPAPGINYVFYRDAPTLTITPDSGQNKIYGSNDPTLTYTFTGLVNGDSPVQSAEFSGALSRNGAGTLAGENVGNYTITQGSLVSTLNYTLDVNPTAVAFTISPATLTYVANPASVVQSSAIPTLTGTVTGFVKDETLASATTGTLEFSTKATINSPAGSYAIDGGGLTADHGNYTLVQAPDNATALIITPTPQTQFISQNVLPTTPPPSLTPGQGGNTQGNRQPGPTGRTGTGPGAGPGGLPPQFGARFFVPAPVGETRYVPNELVLQIPTDIPPTELQAMMERLGLTVVAGEKLDLLGVTLYRVRIGNGRSPASVIQALTAYQNVAGAQPNYTYRLVEDSGVPAAEPGLAQGAALAGREQEGDANQYALSKLGMRGVHRLARGTNVAVAVIDSQIDLNDLELRGTISEQYDATGAGDRPQPHGTGMAGAIAAHLRLTGIAPAARLYAIDAFSSRAGSAESTTFAIVKSIDWAVAKGVRVINMSFAGPHDPSMERALRAAHEQGIVLVAAAGNDGPKSPPLYPGADPNVIAVTATDSHDKVFAGANRGRYIAVAAPGVDILVPAPEGGYQLTTGTSVASAEVSGIVALLLDRNPNLTPNDIRGILTSSARHPGTKQRDDIYGAGLVDPAKALQVAAAQVPKVETAISPPAR